ncbi:type II secretion system protein [Halosimplex carlsbadense 2-9-1]|uniref:Type II secretion system protein n=1 Tax=Halosimplex carlsbadense 2-9-1 TaxID=797114 RepID=M0CMS4_9EURY|nr:type II secretion system F family protein [Halosimplex carlsbadense]ELZ24526.1 type II secretion system protein [Halosimplex carlsbadense 2-9-1]
MSSVLGLAPLLVALALAALIPLSSLHAGLDTLATRTARRYFGRYVPEEAPDRRNRLKEAYVDQTYRAYAAETYLVTVVAALAGAIVGVYVFGGVLLVLPAVGEFIQALPSSIANTLGRPELEPELTPNQVFAVLTAGGAVSGLVVAGFTYWYRWQSPQSHAEVRRRGINEGLPRTVAFVYALSRGGMSTPGVMRTLADNRDVYGHGADEISVAVREMDLFGRDIITAVRNVSKRTPSEQFKTFSENLASVLQSGQRLPGFLRDQYERYQEEAVDRQEDILELLSTIAEAYVTVLVAGTLFLMTILLVFGLTTTQTINFLRLLAYVMIPLANVLFVIYLAGKLDLLGVASGSETGALAESIRGRSGLPGAAPDAADGATAGEDADAPVADGGYTASATLREQLAVYDSLRRVRSLVDRPFQGLMRRPTAILYVTVPVALVSIALRAPGAITANGVQARALDDVLIQAVLVVIGSFAVVWEIYTRRIRRMEAALPELLERLASLNDAGMSVVEGFERVRESDLGVLSVEVDRICRDLTYGANVDDALRRFGLRVRTTATTRVVTLLTNALRASGELAPVLRIAGEQAASELKLRRKRRQQMFTYLVVIYISFAVFLVIIVAVQEVLVPSLPNNVPTPENSNRLAVNVESFARFGQVNKAAYTLVFFHTAIVQAVLSGFIAGQLGEGSLKHGAKHAAIMLAVAYGAFLLLSSPVAQVTFDDQTMTGETVTVDSVSLSEGGYVTVRARTADGEIVGHSEYLAAGSHEGIRIRLESAYSEEMELYAVPHLDTDGDERFGYTGGSVDRTYPTERTRIYDVAQVLRSDRGGSQSLRGLLAGSLPAGGSVSPGVGSF